MPPASPPETTQSPSNRWESSSFSFFFNKKEKNSIFKKLERTEKLYSALFLREGSVKVGGERRRKRKHLRVSPPPPQDGLRKLKGDVMGGEGAHTEKLGRGRNFWDLGGAVYVGWLVVSFFLKKKSLWFPEGPKRSQTSGQSRQTQGGERAREKSFAGQ